MSIFLTASSFFSCFSTIGLHKVQYIPTTYFEQSFLYFHNPSFAVCLFFTNRFISSLPKKVTIVIPISLSAMQDVFHSIQDSHQDHRLPMHQQLLLCHLRLEFQSYSNLGRLD